MILVPIMNFLVFFNRIILRIRSANDAKFTPSPRAFDSKRELWGVGQKESGGQAFVLHLPPSKRCLVSLPWFRPRVDSVVSESTWALETDEVSSAWVNDMMMNESGPLFLYQQKKKELFMLLLPNCWKSVKEFVKTHRLGAALCQTLLTSRWCV